MIVKVLTAAVVLWVLTTPTKAMTKSMPGDSIRFADPIPRDLYWDGTPFLRTVCIVDMNNDGRNDIVIGVGSLFETSHHNIAIFFQSELGQIDTAMKFQLLNDVLSMDTGDLNGDSLPDILCSSRNDGVRGYFQGPDKTLIDGPVIMNPHYPSSVIIADLNGDNKNDFAVAYADLISQDSSWITVFHQGDPGIFTEFTSFSVPYKFGITDQNIEAKDINGDGLIDLIYSGGRYRALVSIYLQEEGGLFSFFQHIPMFSPFHRDIEVNDFNSDGRPDIAVPVSLNSPSYICMFYQDSTGRYPEVPVFYDGFQVPHSVTSGDIDNDGRIDLIVAHTGWPMITIHRQNEEGRFDPYVLFAWSYAGQLYARSLAVGDINGDGSPDVVSVGYYAGMVSMINETGSSSPQSAQFAKIQMVPPNLQEIRNRRPEFRDDGSVRIFDHLGNEMELRQNRTP